MDCKIVILLEKILEMIEKRDFELGKPQDHAKLEEWLNKKDLYGDKVKKSIVPALQKTFLKLVHE